MTAHSTDKRHRLALLVATFAMAFCLPPADAQDTALSSEVMRQAEMIFVGTIEKAGAVATDDVRAADDTAVVTVELMVTPGDWSPLRSFEGRAVTVRLRDPDLLPPGSAAIFYTRLWLVGKGLALIELAHSPVDFGETGRDAAISDAAARVNRILQFGADQALKTRIERADIVVMGEVSSVRKLRSGDGSDMPERLSEHDPQWREAVIEVREVMKGPDMDSTRQIAVRFPGSKDVMWAGAPKFEVGQEGIFILNVEDMLPAAEPARDVAVIGTIVDPANYLSTSEEDRLRALLR